MKREVRRLLQLRAAALANTKRRTRIFFSAIIVLRNLLHAHHAVVLCIIGAGIADQEDGVEREKYVNQSHSVNVTQLQQTFIRSRTVIWLIVIS